MFALIMSVLYQEKRSMLAQEHLLAHGFPVYDACKAKTASGWSVRQCVSLCGVLVWLGGLCLLGLWLLVFLTK